MGVALLLPMIRSSWGNHGYELPSDMHNSFLAYGAIITFFSIMRKGIFFVQGLRIFKNVLFVRLGVWMMGASILQ